MTYVPTPNESSKYFSFLHLSMTYYISPTLIPPKVSEMRLSGTASLSIIAALG